MDPYPPLSRPPRASFGKAAKQFALFQTQRWQMVLFRIRFIGETRFLSLFDDARFLPPVMLPAVSARSPRAGDAAVGWAGVIRNPAAR